MAQEMHFGNLGLGNALAVAYDLYADPGSQQQMMYTQIPVSNVSFSPNINDQLFRQATRQTGGSAGATTVTQYVIQQPDCQSSLPMEAFSYLNPISTGPSIQQSFLPVTSAFSAPQTHNLHHQQQYEYSSVATASSTGASNSGSSGVHMLNGQSSTSSSCVSPTSQNSLENSCQQNSFTQQQQQTSVSVSTPKSGKGRASMTNGSSSGSDDGMYDITEEEISEIDDSLACNEEVVKSRHWKYYIETNEWTRATCALMACLFSREQMANSTVLGRGGAQRERLPTNLVAYVVTKIRRRFGKPAAAVRARMAQKCKDERRFGRNPANVVAMVGKTGRGSAVPNGASPSVAVKRGFESPEKPAMANGAKRKPSANGVNNNNNMNAATLVATPTGGIQTVTTLPGSPTSLAFGTGHSTILLSPTLTTAGGTTSLLFAGSSPTPQDANNNSIHQTGAHQLLSPGQATATTTTTTLFTANGAAHQLQIASNCQGQPILYQNESTAFMLNGQLYHQHPMPTGSPPIFIPHATAAAAANGGTFQTTAVSPVPQHTQNVMLLPAGHCLVQQQQPGTPGTPCRIGSPIPQVGSPTTFMVATPATQVAAAAAAAAAAATHQPSTFARL